VPGIRDTSRGIVCGNLRFELEILMNKLANSKIESKGEEVIKMTGET
jgi:hypothetical protein